MELVSNNTVSNIRKVKSDIKKMELVSNNTVLSVTVSSGGKDGCGKQVHVPVQGLDSGMVVAVAFSAFCIGILLTAVLWFIHVHTTGKMGDNRACQSPWWSLRGLLSWCPICKASHWDFVEDLAPLGFIYSCLNHCGLMTPYGDRGLGQHWLR